MGGRKTAPGTLPAKSTHGYSLIKMFLIFKLRNRLRSWEMCVFVKTQQSLATCTHTITRLRVYAYVLHTLQFRRVPPFCSHALSSAMPATKRVEDEERSNQLSLGLMLCGHTYLSRVHATVQCMTMCKGTVDGKKFAIGVHATRHVTIPMQTPLSPSHSMLTE